MGKKVFYWTNGMITQYYIYFCGTFVLCHKLLKKILQHRFVTVHTSIIPVVTLNKPH